MPISPGATPLEVAGKLRPARVTTTLTTYGHLFPGTDDRLDGLLADTYTRLSRPNRGPTRTSGGTNPR
jgi:hypothetical protein